VHNVIDGFLPVDVTLQVMEFNTVLNSDIAGIAFAIDKGRAIVFSNAG